MGYLFGIDVSRCQKDIKWNKVKKDFAIIKITNKGNIVEDCFEQNYKGATENNITIGGYKYVYAKTVAEAKAEAEGMLKVLNGRKLPYGIWIDMEDKSIRNIGKQNLSAVILEEAEILKAAGYNVGVYCNYDWYKNVLDSTMLEKHYPFWIARYKKPDIGVYDDNWFNSPKSYAPAWQYSSKGRVDGINGNVDLDVLFTEDIFKQGGNTAMASVIFGSARHDEKGKYTGGKAGDQTGQEVSTQPYYNHSKKWYALRAKDPNLAVKIAQGMLLACNNNHIGYSQSDRYGVYKLGIDTNRDCNADCSELIRAILKWCGVNIPDVTTANLKKILMDTGLFDCVAIEKASDCYTGDILVTRTKGHTGAIISGKPRAINPVVEYTQDQFIADVMAILKVSKREKILENTITISAKTNKHHALVTPIERYMKSLGYYNGAIEADLGQTPDFGDGMTTAIKKYQKNVVKATSRNQDGVISKKGATWKKMLGL